jgi:hypothetical protein
MGGRQRQARACGPSSSAVPSTASTTRHGSPLTWPLLRSGQEDRRWDYDEGCISERPAIDPGVAWRFGRRPDPWAWLPGGTPATTAGPMAGGITQPEGPARFTPVPTCSGAFWMCSPASDPTLRVICPQCPRSALFIASAASRMSGSIMLRCNGFAAHRRYCPDLAARLPIFWRVCRSLPLAT